VVRFRGWKKGLWLRPAAAVFLLLAFLSAGCGSGAQTTGKEAREKPDSYAVAHGESIEDCLIEVGVQFAVAPHDIAFFDKAREGGDVAEGGSAYDVIDKVDVRLLVAKQGGAKQWMLWYSLPPSSSRGPDYVAHHLTSQSAGPIFVAFKVKPKFSFRREIRRCIRFPLFPRRAPFVELPH
jgi:hypothetical protein